MTRSIWKTLGVSPTTDERDIRRAYARRLKEVHPEDDPEGFKALREAHDDAMLRARHRRRVAPGAPSSGADTTDFDTAGPDAVATEGPRIQVVDWNAGPTRGDAALTPDPDARATPRPSARPDPVVVAVEAERRRADEEEAAHKVLCDRLSALITAGEPDAETRLDALLAVLRSPAMGSLTVHERTEAWLGGLLGSHGTPELLESGIAYFGWNDGRVGHSPYGHEALRRRDVQAAFRSLSSPLSRGHMAWRALRDAPNWRTRLSWRLDPGLPAQVRALLERLRWEMPEAVAWLNPEAVAWWDDYLSGPRLHGWVWRILGGAEVLVALLTVVAFTIPTTDHAQAAVVAATLAAGAVLLVLIPSLAWLHLISLPRHRWLAAAPWTRPASVRLGWAPATAILLLAAATIPIAWPWQFAYVAPLLALFAWTHVTTAHTPLSGPEASLRSHASASLPLLIWLIVHSHGGAFVALDWCVGAAVSLSRIGGGALTTAWLDLKAGLRERLGASLAVLAVLAAVALVLAPSWPLRTIVAAATAVLVLAARPIGQTQSPRHQRIRYWWSVLGWFPCLLAGLAFPERVVAVYTFAAFGVWLLGGVILTGLFEAAPHLERFLPMGGRKRLDKFS